MKPEFRFPDERVAFWVPMAIRAAQVTPGGFGPRAVARLAPGTDRAAVVAQLEPLARRVQQRLGGPAPYVRIMERHRPVVKPLREHLVGRISTALWILLGTVGIVFLIACANVASLFTVRAENRRLDLAVRRALGRRTRRSGALAGDGGVASGGRGRRGRRAASRGPASRSWSARHRMRVAGGFGGAPIPGLATARLDPARRCSSPRASRCWRRARSGCCPPSASRARAWAASSRPDEASSAADSDARRAGGRADRRCARPAGRMRRCSCAASGSSVTSTRDTTRRTSSPFRSQPAAPN